MRSGAVALFVVLLALVVSAPAHGAVIPGQVIAGPSTNIAGEPSLAIAPDGTGVVAYRQGDGGNARVWASRRLGGVWQPPQQLTSGGDVTTSSVVVGAANGGRVIVAFKGGTGAGDAAFRYSPGAGQPFGPLTAIRMSDVSSLALDMNAGGVSYALVHTSGQALFAYRIVGGTVAPVGAPDAVDTNAASGDFINPDAAITVDAAGNAVAAWAQNPPPNTALARRLTGTTLAPAAVAASATSLGGFPASSGGASYVGVHSDDSGRAWVTFRQQFAYGGGNDRFRGVARRLVGGAFEPALRIDNNPPVPASGREVELPTLAVTPSGSVALAAGHANTAATGAPYLAFGATVVPGSASPFALHGTPAPEETFESVAVVPRGAGLFAFSIQQTSTSPGEVRARVRLQGGGLDPATLTLSDPALGRVPNNIKPAAADGADSAFVAYLQDGDPGAPILGRILVAQVDLPRLPVGNAADRTAPRVTRFSLSRKRFRKGTKLPKLSAVKTGTTLRFRMSEKATVRLSFERKRLGRRVGRKCRKQTRKNRRRKRCTRYVKVKTAIRLNGKAGSNRVRFQGRLSRRRSLAPGSYRISLVATDAAKNASKRQRKTFKLLKAAKRKR